MPGEPTPTFDEWVEYCFTRGYQDFHSEDVPVEQCRRHLDLDDQVLPAYLIRLFQAPAFIAEGYTDDQIAEAVWFLFGGASEYITFLLSDAVDKDAQIACLRSVESMYLRLFDRVCCKRAADPDGQYWDTLKLDIAVYMIWDMGGIETGVIFDDGWPHLLAPGLEVLEHVLMNCKTSTCMVSVLHGLGHLWLCHPRRCEPIIDRFLAERHAPDWVREYAARARVGGVQ